VRVFKKISQVAKRILIRHEVNAQFAAARVQLLNILRGECSPATPNGFIFPEGEGVFGVKLQFVDFEIRKFIRQVEQRRQLRHSASRDIDHHAAAGEVRPVADLQARQPAAMFTEQLPQGRQRRALATSFTE